jgi:hypothetical protein
MVIEIDTSRDTPEEIQRKIASMAKAAEDERPQKRKSLAHLCGAVKWEEDALAYQKRLRDEWK